MLTHLLFMRHAKPVDPDGQIPDHTRPLSEDGKIQARLIGAALQARGYGPDIIWCSDAARTRQTALNLIRSLDGAQSITYSAEFYHASARQVLSLCANQEPPTGRLMLLGHNPGWAELHRYFTGQSQDFPPGACTIFRRLSVPDDDANWIATQNWQMIDHISPQSLSI